MAGRSSTEHGGKKSGERWLCPCKNFGGAGGVAVSVKSALSKNSTVLCSCPTRCNSKHETAVVASA